MKYQLLLDTIYNTTILFKCILNASHKYLIIPISTIKQHPHPHQKKKVVATINPSSKSDDNVAFLIVTARATTWCNSLMIGAKGGLDLDLHNSAINIQVSK